MKLSHKVSNVSTVSNVSGVLSKTKLVNIQSNHFINDLTHSTHLTHNTHLKRTGFTLAEVLITLGIIGVVAAITIPTLIANINDKVYKSRHENIAQKVTQAMEQMKALGKLDASYNSTEAFVDELQKYLKISKRCSAENIADCWPTDKITTLSGKTFEIANAKESINLGLDTDTENVGLILADGASIILNYNPESEVLDIGSRVTINPDFKYTTSVTDSIDFVTDVNGAKRPNTSGRDIRSFKYATLGDDPCPGGKMSGNSCVKVLSGAYTHSGAVDACDNAEPQGSWELPMSSTFRSLAVNKHVPAGYYWTNDAGVQNGSYIDYVVYHIAATGGYVMTRGDWFQFSALCVAKAPAAD